MSSHRLDSKTYKGKIESIFVSVEEAWKVERFIDQYLDLRGYKVNNTNRDLVAQRLEGAPGRPPYRIENLVEWLDEKYKVASRGTTGRPIFDPQAPELSPSAYGR
ncbi:hypothetical protein ABQX22_18310 [Xanthomonas sp. WHRI 1810A]|uniref:hypothetical protein n=1 Tax=Xanthomonas sp. WHRI 1810A TaxID=3161565 RepID=UPI0032E85CB3